MGKVAREMVQKAGINIDVLLKKLVAAAGAEFTTFYYYTILRVAAIGMEGEGMKEIIEDARIEDRNHFEALVPRIYELGGELPRDICDFAKQAGCPDAYLPDSLKSGKSPTGSSLKDLLTVLVEAEALRHPHLHRHLPVHPDEGPAHLRHQRGHPQRGD